MKRREALPPNPRTEEVQALIWRYAGRQIDFVLAVGGGSVIDSAKCVALGLATPEIPVWQYFIKAAAPQRTLPVGAVLTIPAAGSESSNSAVLTEQASGIKRGLTWEGLRPRFAILNPELCYTLPPYQIACGVTDMMMHTMDRYFNNRLGNQLTDALGEALLRTVIHNGTIALENPRDYDAMSELMWCGSVSHNELTGLGGAHDFSVHQLGHVLSGLYNMAHGATLAVMWPAWARYVWRSNPQRFVDFAQRVWGVTEEGESAVFAGIERTEQYFRRLACR